ncbi:MAG: LUD domain-containing protein [Kiritimatiellia bacterium]
MLVTSRSSGGRALSVLPEHHIVIATADQLIGGLSDAYDLLHNHMAGTCPAS